MANISEVNFDHPDAFDFDEALRVITELMLGNDVTLPNYDFVSSSRVEPSIEQPSKPIVVFEGIMALYDQRIVDKMDLKIFVNTDDDIRLSRRIMRDVAERGRTVESVIEAYNKFVKPSYDGFIRPTMKSADIIIPCLLYTSPSPRDLSTSRMPSSA